MIDDDLDRLRAEVERHTGPARARPLTELGQALAQRYWQVGPGSVAGEPWLDEAIRVLDEAHRYLEPGQYQRALHGSVLGWLLGARNMAHAGPPADGERGVALLTEALEFQQLPPTLQVFGRILLGQLLLNRVTRSMRSPDFTMRLLESGLGAEESTAADRAVRCFQEVLERSDSAELTSIAQTCLALAKTLQMMAGGLGGDPAGLDLGRMVTTMSDLQDLQQQVATAPDGSGFGRIPNPFQYAVDDLAALDPMDRPVAVVEGAAPSPTAMPPPAVAPIKAEPAATFREALVTLLPGARLSGLLELLEGPVSADVVDLLVPQAAALADAPDATAADRLPVAVALYLRSVVDPGGGWGDEDGDDLRDVRMRLLDAAGGISTGDAEHVVVAFLLADRLDEQQPALAVRRRLTESFTAVTTALKDVGSDALLYRAGNRQVLLRADAGVVDAAEMELPARIVMTGDGPVPFGPIVSVVRDGAQLVALAGRARRPVIEDALFVANPRGDRPVASMEALVLRRCFYPHSTGLGDTGENSDGAGTPSEVSARLNASLIHLGCGVTAAGGLELAGPAVLAAERIAAAPLPATGGLAVLPSTAGSATLTDALLASPCIGVIRFRADIPADVASIVYVVLHAELVDAHHDPAAAVAAVRAWLADPARVPPDVLPGWLVATAADPGLADPVVRDALEYHGV